MSSIHSAGFTLLEMLAALALIALIVSLALPIAGHRTSVTAMRAFAYEIAAILDADRYAARRRGSVIITAVDSQSYRIISGATGAAIVWPSQIDVRSSSLRECDDATEKNGIAFYPDGYACGLSIVVATGEHAININVCQLTGSVTIVE
jgi:general secretion pathway protein H